MNLIQRWYAFLWKRGFRTIVRRIVWDGTKCETIYSWFPVSPGRFKTSYGQKERVIYCHVGQMFWKVSSSGGREPVWQQQPTKGRIRWVGDMSDGAFLPGYEVPSGEDGLGSKGLAD